MNKELEIRKCLKCGKVVNVISGNSELVCCGSPMTLVTVNSSDGAVEKHKPSYSVINDKLKVVVNHVMDEDHYIEWISVIYKDKKLVKYYKPGEEAVLECPYEIGAVIYSYCNKHGLWKTDVE